MKNNTMQIPADGLDGLKQNWKDDMLSGFLVFLIALPLCLGIALASGFPPIGGIFTAIIGGLIVGPICGSRLTIKGPAAGLIAIAVGSVEALGKGDAMAGYKLTLAVIVVASLIQIVFGLIKAGKLNDFFPASAVHGMLAAIGIIIISKQIHTLFGVKPEAKEPLELLAEIPHTIASMNPEIAIIGLVSLAILITLPLVKNKYIKMIPAPMLVILIAIPLGHLFDLEHEHKYLFLDGHEYTLGPKFLVTLPANIADGITFPDFSQIFTFESFKYILMFALVGSIESLLTVKAIDGLDPFKRKSNYNKDLVAVGIGNTVAGLIGGLPMISEVVRSSANVNNGAKTRWANFFHGGFLLVFVAFAPFLIHQIPLAALAAMLVFTGYRLASPKHFTSTFKIGREQLVIFVVTIVVTLATDLLVGIAAGIITKFIIHIISGAPLKYLFKATVQIKDLGKDSIELIVENAAIFSNYLGFKKHLDSLPQGKHIVLNFAGTRMIDHTFMENLHHFEHDYQLTGGKVEIRGMEKHKPVSAHPMAARRVSKAQSTGVILTERQKQIENTALHTQAAFESTLNLSVAIFRQFPLFAGAKLRYRENTLTKVIEGVKIEITDVKGSRLLQLSETDIHATVILISKLPVPLPDFVLEKEDIIDSLKGLSGYNDIDFMDYPRFSAHYLLKGKDTARVRSLFTSQLIGLLESNLHYYVESKDNTLLVHRNQKLADGKTYKDMLTFSEQLVESLLKLSPQN
ncbi:SulP family inorganic anion transporter [Rhodocytophaga aerolata]|uniref:SulP family inorganic anion transporter n=1 Tax=Rhodocytophaga aerolata TaxID=455078 RepID=UPI003458A77B